MMTLPEAAAKLGWHPNTLHYWLRQIGFKPIKKRILVPHYRTCFDLSDDDLAAIRRERRRRQHVQSEEKSKLLKRVNQKWQATNNARYDPERRRAAGLKGAKASAGRSLRKRAWRERHDIVTVEKPKPEHKPHPWRAPETARIEEIKARRRRES
jgi:hypothetical protein